MGDSWGAFYKQPSCCSLAEQKAKPVPCFLLAMLPCLAVTLHATGSPHSCRVWLKSADMVDIRGRTSLMQERLSTAYSNSSPHPKPWRLLLFWAMPGRNVSLPLWLDMSLLLIRSITNWSWHTYNPNTQKTREGGITNWRPALATFCLKQPEREKKKKRIIMNNSQEPRGDHKNKN